MIAYNHYIQFISKPEDTEKPEGSFSNIITVKESSQLNIKEKMPYWLPFTNNQDRDLMLYTDRNSRTQDGQLWSFEIKNVVTCFWHSGTLKIEYIRHENFTDELLRYWCLHIVLPIFFTIEETYDFLHAGAVEVEGKPILFVAESFGGKSTMTDFFMKQGHTVLSDDKVGFYEKNNLFYAIPSHPHHRPYRKMEDLGYFIENFSSTPLPVHAVYELEKDDEDSLITITELTGMKKFKSLRFASEMNVSFLKQKRFEYLTHMAKSVPIYKVTVPWKIDRLYEVYEAIVKHTQNIKV